MVTFRRLLTKWLEGAATIKIKPNTQSTSTLYGDNQGSAPSFAKALSELDRDQVSYSSVV
jgi:hypothetical protein